MTTDMLANVARHVLASAMTGRSYGEPEPMAYPTPQFHCDCPTRYMHDYGTTCPRCHRDGTNGSTLPTSKWLIWTDDYGSQGPAGLQYRCSFFDKREDEPLGESPAFGKKSA